MTRKDPLPLALCALACDCGAAHPGNDHRDDCPWLRFVPLFAERDARVVTDAVSPKGPKGETGGSLSLEGETTAFLTDRLARLREIRKGLRFARLVLEELRDRERLLSAGEAVGGMEHPSIGLLRHAARSLCGADEANRVDSTGGSHD